MIGVMSWLHGIMIMVMVYGCVYGCLTLIPTLARKLNPANHIAEQIAYAERDRLIINDNNTTELNSHHQSTFWYCIVCRL